MEFYYGDIKIRAMQTLKNIILNLLPDKIFLELKYAYFFHKKLNLKSPMTFNEKLQWLKLYNRNPLYTKLVDKFLVRSYVEKKIGKEFLIPLLGVWENFSEIKFDKLPQEFVLKPNHTSGDVFICHNKDSIDYRKLEKLISYWLRRDYYKLHREWPYKDVQRKIIAETLLKTKDNKPLIDYKFFCFNGIPQLMFVATDRGIDTKFDFFDMNFTHLNLINGHSNAVQRINKPPNFEKMKILAAKLSEGIPHVRIDFYEVNGHVYFGEMTFFHWSGFVKFKPEEWDYKLGKMLDLSMVSDNN